MAAFQIHEDIENVEALNNKNRSKKQVLKVSVDNIEKIISRCKYEKNGSKAVSKKTFLDNWDMSKVQKCVTVVDSEAGDKLLERSSEQKNKVNRTSIEEPFLEIEKENRLASVVEEEKEEVFPLSLLHSIEYRKMFRHGNRTPNGEEELYPNDPYLNKTYFPYGLGQLTNAGKIKQYYVGTELRNRYNNFLGKYYYPDLVEATSTDYNRTKMSIELVLAGLFPPRKDDAVLGIPWQPIPYNFLPRFDDIVLLGPECPKYTELYEEYSNRPSVQEKFHKYNEVFNYISKHSGLNVTRFKDVYYLHFGLAAEEEYGLALPEWTKFVWPDTIMGLSPEEYFISLGTPELKKLAVGHFWQKLLLDAAAKIQDGNKLSRKIHLYSAHESTMAHLLISMNLFDKHVPPYSSYIVWELHKIHGMYGFKIYYKRWDGSGLRLMQMPGCKQFCPLDVFTALIEDYLPDDSVMCGN